MASRQGHGALRGLGLVLGLGLALATACELEATTTGWSCGTHDTCGEQERLSFVVIDDDPVLGSGAVPVSPLAVGATADIGVLGLSGELVPEYVMEARVEPSDLFTAQIADDGTFVAVTALGQGTGELHVVTRDGEEDVLALEALSPVNYEVRLSTPPMLASLEAWDDPDLDMVPFAYTPGTDLHATLEAQGPLGIRLAGFGVADWVPLDSALAVTQAVERTDAMHIEIAEELVEGELLVLESGTDATRVVPVELPDAIETIEWELLESPLAQQVELEVGEPLDLFVRARDGLGNVMVPSPAQRLELDSDVPDRFTIDHHDLRDYITVEAIEPGTYDVGLSYLGQQRQVQLVVAGG